MKNTSYRLENYTRRGAEETLLLRNGCFFADLEQTKTIWVYDHLYPLIVLGDMTGDGKDEAAVVLRRESGASARMEILVLFAINGDELQQIASVQIGQLPTTHYPHTKSIIIRDGILTINNESENFPDASEPLTKYQVNYRFAEGELVVHP